eukprot:scaffold2114_cov253-Pinguiococcus_pyrenoidosus.AAC.16
MECPWRCGAHIVNPFSRMALHRRMSRISKNKRLEIIRNIECKSREDFEIRHYVDLQRKGAGPIAAMKASIAKVSPAAAGVLEVPMTT